MRFELSDDQALLRNSTRDFLASEHPLEKSRAVMEHSKAGYDPAEWRRLAEMGYVGLVLPARVGEIKDVALNAVAIGCALVVLRAFAPPPAGHAPRAAWAPARRLAAVVVVALAAFVHTVHLGVRVVDGPRAFDSRFTPAELDRAAAARARAWAGAPPLVRPDRLSREDQYATEGLQHVQARNQAWAAGDAATAWHENLVLERFFAPVLDTPSYVSKTGHRWSPGQRAEAAGRAAAGTGAPFVSAAFPSPLWRLPAPAVWASAAIVALALWPWRAGRPGVSP